MTVAGIDPVNPQSPFLPAAVGRGKLALRVSSALVMVPLALGAAYYCGIVFLVFWMIAALGVLWEWDAMVCAHDKNPVFTIGAVALIGTSALWAIERLGPALILIALGLLGVATLASKIRRGWCVAGLAYAGAILLGPVVLRRDPTLGLAAILFLFGVVWSTDIGAYIAGRGLGGPKLAPRMSPNKTWTGALGGLAAGVCGGLAAAKFAGLGDLVVVGLLAFILSIASQGGDLLESAIKRQFNVKDTSGLIPGHGGLMDRLDGFVIAAALAAIIGFARGGFDAPGRGLLVW